MSQIKKDIRSLLVSSAITKPLDLLKGFFVIKFLTPEMYGFLNIINQISSFAKYGDIGFTSVVEREYNYEIQKNKDKAQKVKNIAYSAEIILSIILFVLIFIVAFLYKDNFIVFIGIISSAFILLFTKIMRLYKTNLRIEKNFKSFAKFNTFQGIIFNLSIIALIPFIGIYAPLIIGVVVNSFVLYIFYKKVNLNFKFIIEKKELLRQLKIGIALGGLTFLYGSSIFIERYLIATNFGLKEVGYFAFSMFIIMFMQHFIYDMVRPYIPRVKEEIAKGNYGILKKYSLYPTIKLVIGIIFLVIFLEWLIPILVFKFFSQYIEALGIIQITLLLLIPISISAFSGYLLYSPGIDRIQEAYISYIIYIGIILFFGLIYNLNFKNLIIVFVIASLIKNLYQTFYIWRLL